MSEQLQRPQFYVHRGRAVIDLLVLHQLARRSGVRKQMIATLTKRLDTERTLLRSALHELAIARGEDPVRFMRQWQQERREIQVYEDDE